MSSDLGSGHRGRNTGRVNDTTTAGGVRARVRAELTEAIKTTARAHIASEGASGLSLRAVARELKMASSAIYRYFPSREALLTALIVDAYDTLGAQVEEAEATCNRDDFEDRWLTVAHAVRDWALENPNEYALIYGSPVPGYAAPEDTVGPATRVPVVMFRLLADMVEAGVAVAAPDPIVVDEVLAAEFESVASAAGVSAPPGLVASGMASWAQTFGLISFELFGHLENVVTPQNRRVFFDHAMRAAAARLGA